MIKIIKKIFGAIGSAFKWMRYWIDYWELKPGAEVIGLILALCCAALLFFLPSYNPPYNMTTDKFAKLCENNGFEMLDLTDKYFYVNGVTEDTLDDYTLKYYSCEDICYARFYGARETRLLRGLGGKERNVYNSKFQLTTFTNAQYTAVVYRNGAELLIVSGPTTDAETLSNILKKCRLPKV